MEKGADFKWLKRTAKDQKSKEWISKIEEWHKVAFDKGKFVKSKQLFPVNLGKWFRR
jgi:hypothetical protein